MQEFPEIPPRLARTLTGYGRPLNRAVFRPEVHGIHHVPALGPAILAGNHVSWLDTFLLATAVPRPVAFAAKSEYFTRPGIVGRVLRGYFEGMGHFPVDRSGTRGVLQAIEGGMRTLERGWLLGVFPEGTRSPDGRLYRGRTGLVALCALRSGVPVVPYGISGIPVTRPAAALSPRTARPVLRFGEPLTFPGLEERCRDLALLREVTDRVMRRIAVLSGQEYVDVYASAVKRRVDSSTSRTTP